MCCGTLSGFVVVGIASDCFGENSHLAVGIKPTFQIVADLQSQPISLSNRRRSSNVHALASNHCLMQANLNSALLATGISAFTAF